MQTGAKEGMVTMENALKKLVADGLIDKEVLEKRGGRKRKV